MKKLINKTIVITGASSGIGEACAHAFAQAGANLLLCARRINKLNILAEQLISQYPIRVLTRELDITQLADVNRTFSTLPNDWNNLDVLINNAGLAAGLDFLFAGDIEDWERMIDTNLKGLLYVTKAILPTMITRNQGHIINIGSIAGHEVYPKGNVYCATKYAVRALTRAEDGFAWYRNSSELD